MSKKSRKQQRQSPVSLHPSATKADYPDNGAEMAYWLAPNGRITALKQGSGMYGAGYPQFIDGAVGPNIPLSFTPMGFAAAYTVSTWLYRCVEVRKQAVDRMPWSVVNVRRKNDAFQHPLFVALKRNRQHLLRQIEQTQLLYGESFIELAINDFNYTSDLYWLNNLGMAVLIGVGEITGYSYTALNGGMSQGFAPNQVAFMRTENPFNDLRGMSPVEVVLDEVAIDKDVARVVRSFYANDTRVGMLLIPKRDLNDADAKRFMDVWKMQNQGVNKAGKPVLVPQDLTVERAQTPPSLDDVELRESTRRDICAGLGVPLAIAGAWDDANYDSVDTQRKSFYEETVIPECDRITDFINNDIMPAFDSSGLYRFEFDYTATMALIEDAVQKTEIYSTRLNSGMITRAEARAAIGHEVRPEDDVFYIPTGVTVVPANQPAYVTPNTNVVEDNPQQQQELSQSQIDAPKDKPALPASTEEKQPEPPAEDKPEEKTAVKVEIITEDLMLSELAAWQKKVSNKGAVKAAQFECRYLPGDIADVVRSGLLSGANIRDLFTAARTAAKMVKDFDPNQPRDEGGQWSETGAGGSGGSSDKPKPATSTPVNKKPAPKPETEEDEESPASTIGKPGTQKYIPVKHTLADGKAYEINIPEQAGVNDVDAPLKRSQLTKFESKSTKLKIEQGAVYDKSGNLIASSSGIRGSVSIHPDDMSKAAGGTFTHNHPGGSSFSDPDFAAMVKHKVGEFRASVKGSIFGDGAFSMRRTETTPADVDIKSIGRASYAEAQTKFPQHKFRTAMGTGVDDNSIRHIWIHEANKITAKKLGMVYEFQATKPVPPKFKFGGKDYK